MSEEKVEQGLVEHLSSFLEYWNSECKATDTLLRTIPEELLHRELISGYRSLARLAWHIVQSPKEMLALTGLTIDAPGKDTPVPETLDEIVAAHEKVWHAVEDCLLAEWSDSSLRLVDAMYGEKWTRSFTLGCLLLHLVHHRGQMTVLLRLGKAKVKGLYGPSKEEWANYGMVAPAV